jgi:hypothetical protein
MEMFNKPVLLLALAMFLAIGTERLLELVRALLEHLEARGGPGDRWQKKAEALRNRIEVRLDNAGAGKSSPLQMVLSIVCRHLSPAPPESGGLIAIYVEQVRKLSIRVRFKVLAVLSGIGLAFLFGVDIFALVNEQLHGTDGFEIQLPGWLGTVVSGIAMGFGAGPVHKMITALERARGTRI